MSVRFWSARPRSRLAGSVVLDGLDIPGSFVAWAVSLVAIVAAINDYLMGDSDD